MCFWREIKRWMRLPSFSTRCLKVSAASWLFLLLGGKLPSCTTFQSSLWLQPRQKIPELLLCIFSWFSNTFKPLCYRHGQIILFSGHQACVFHNMNSPRLDSSAILVTQPNLQIRNNTSNLTFNSRKREELKPSRSTMLSVLWRNRLASYLSFYKLVVTI